MKKRMLAGLMAACILWTTLPASAFQEDGPAEPAASAVADGDTRYGYKNVLGEDATSTQNAGRMWVDHTVSTANSLTFDGVDSEQITREAGEDFLVTYSALSSTSEVSILPDTTPSDTIFVLDFSMTMNRNMNGEYVTDNEFSTTRTKAMLDAMDETITTLKQANEDNRVGIVTFCGLSDVLLPLTRLGDITAVDEDEANAEIPVTGYQGDKPVIYKTENRFFSVSKSIPGGNNRNWVRCNITNGRVNMLSDWTSMQAGLYEALKMFRKGWPDGTEQDLKSRRANVIVITDGDSNTLAKQIANTPWYENMTTDEGEYNKANGGNLAFATLLTAAYLKYEAGQRYESCSMYTVGLSTTELMQLLLNPSEYMKEHSSESIVTSTKNLWNQYKNGTNPPNISGITFEAAKDANESIVPENYDYVDEFFDTSNADELADAFRTITKEIILAEAQAPTDVDDSKPAKSGYVTYTAPLGEYMEVKDVKCIIFQNRVFKDKEKSTSTSGNCTTYEFSGKVDSPVYGEESLSDIVIQVEQEDGTHQIVTIKIPASVMPLRNNTIRLNSHGLDEVESHETEDNAPMRIVYSVGLMDEVDRKTLAGVSPEYIAANTADDGTVLFYCNAYDKQEISEGRTAGSVTAEFTAGDTNPFYYAPAGTVLYTYENGNYMVATEYQKGITYYVKQDYYHKDVKGDSIYVPGWLGRNDLKEEDTKVETLEDGSKQLVLSRSILKEVNMANARNEKREGDNRSETADYAYYATEKARNPGEFLAYLGNNGRLGLENPLGELTISKTVKAAEGERLPENAEDTVFTLNLTASLENVPLTGEFFYEVYNSENSNTASGRSVTFASGAAAFTIESGQVIRLFLPKGTSITVSETPTNGYTVSYKNGNTAVADDKNFAADTDAADIQVINTFTEAKIDILVKKVWNDNNDQDGKRPESITVKLLFNGSEGTALTLSEENGWQGTFTGLDQYDDGGNEITYTIEEVEVEGYETSITWYDTTCTITNTHTPESEPEPATGNLKVSKTVDGNSGDTAQEFHFTVTLSDTSISGTYGDMEFKDGVATFALKHGESKTASGLPVGVTYTAAEQEANQDGYTTTATGTGGTIAEGVTAEAIFTNTKEDDPEPGPDPKPETGSLTVSKTVAGNNGDTTKEFHFTVTLSDTSISDTYGDMTFENGVASFALKHGESKTASGLPVDITYTVVEQEDNKDGYTTTATGTGGTITKDVTAEANFTNTKEDDPEPGPDPKPETGSLTVSKTVAGNNGDTTKEFHFTVTLSDTSISDTYGDMTFENGVASFALKHGESKTASGLPVDITYTVVEQEDNKDGYTTTATGTGGTITKDVTAEANFTNTKNSNPGPGPDPDSVDIAVQKVWKLDDGGTAADSVTVTLYRDGKEHDTVNLNAQNGWRHTWHGLSDRYSWTVEETAVPEGFTMTVNQQGYTFIIVNDDIPSKPDEPDEPDVPDTPDKPDEPDIPDDPDTPDEPDVPDTPDEPDIPDDPDTNIPDEPTPGDNVPGDPDTPDTPDEPDQPDEPGLPQTGQQWLLAGLLAVAGAALVVTGLWYKTRYRGKHEA